ncbi:hypothetical protein EG68_10377, partial [Paragonimus skrjabini miyazakii]
SSDSNSESDPELTTAEQEKLFCNLDETQGLTLLASPSVTKLPKDRMERTRKKPTRKHKTGPQRNQEVRTRKRSQRVLIDRFFNQNILQTTGTTCEKINGLLQEPNIGESKLSYVSKYSGQSNGGIPCFVEKRLMERACQKLYHLWTNTSFTSAIDVRRYWQAIEYIQSKVKSSPFIENQTRNSEERRFLRHLSWIKHEAQRHETELHEEQNDVILLNANEMGCDNVYGNRDRKTVSGGFPTLQPFFKGMLAVPRTYRQVTEKVGRRFRAAIPHFVNQCYLHNRPTDPKYTIIRERESDVYFSDS